MRVSKTMLCGVNFACMISWALTFLICGFVLEGIASWLFIGIALIWSIVLIILAGPTCFFSGVCE